MAARFVMVINVGEYGVDTIGPIDTEIPRYQAFLDDYYEHEEEASLYFEGHDVHVVELPADILKDTAGLADSVTAAHQQIEDLVSEYHEDEEWNEETLRWEMPPEPDAHLPLSERIRLAEERLQVLKDDLKDDTTAI